MMIQWVTDHQNSTMHHAQQPQSLGEPVTGMKENDKGCVPKAEKEQRYKVSIEVLAVIFLAF